MRFVFDDRFDVLRLNATGTTSVVWEARDPARQATVAIKTPRPGFAARGDFYDHERAVSAALSDLRGVVPLLGFGHAPVAMVDPDAATPYLVFAFQEDGTLAGRVAQAGPQPPAQVAGWVTALAEALDAAHGRGFVHGDVKPGNVMLCGGEARLIDFGAHLPLAGQTLPPASLGFLAPERLRDGLPTPAADRFALAATALAALIGRFPFEGASIADILARLQAGCPASALNDLPIGLRSAFAQALCADPDRRPATSVAFATALTAAVEDAVVA
jgi:serine/threonine-protein kinase